MFTSLLGINRDEATPEPKEGDLYRVISAHGKEFRLYYGYYEDQDRENPDVKPMEIYPSFIREPVYTDEGIPFATAMQKPCENYKGEDDEDATCYQCAYYERCEELLGLCKCKARQRKFENK